MQAFYFNLVKNVGLNAAKKQKARAKIRIFQTQTPKGLQFAEIKRPITNKSKSR